MTTFRLRPRVPLGAILVVVVGVLLMAVAFVAGQMLDSVIPHVLLGVIVVALIAYAVLVVRSRRLATVEVVLDAEGYQILGPAAQRREGAWADVTKVTGTDDRLLIYHGADARVHLVHPAHQADTIMAIAREMVTRLDASRGLHG